MIRNGIGSLIALVGAALAVWSVFLPWYAGREGQDFALSDLFTADGVTGAEPALLAGLFLPMAVAALVTLAGVLLRSRLLVALAALIVLAFTVLWIVRQGLAAGSLTVGGDTSLDWGVGIAFAGVVALLFGGLFMAGRRRPGHGRHRGAPDTRLRRRSERAPVGATAAGAGAGATGLAAAGRDDERTRPEPVARGDEAGRWPAAEPAAPAAGPGAPAEDTRSGRAAAPWSAAEAAGAGGTSAAGGDEGEPGMRGEPVSPPSGMRGEETARPATAAEPGASRAAGAAGEGTDESEAARTRPMPHTQPVTGSRGGASTARAGTGAGEQPEGAAEPAPAPGGTGQDTNAPSPASRKEGAGMGTFPRDEHAGWEREDSSRPAAASGGPAGAASTGAGTGPTPGEAAPRPLAEAGAGGPSRSGDLRAEKGPDAMRPEQARAGTAPEPGEPKEPLPQRLLHRLQHAGHRGQHGPRGGDHRDAA